MRLAAFIIAPRNIARSPEATFSESRGLETLKVFSICFPRLRGHANSESTKLRRFHHIAARVGLLPVKTRTSSRIVFNHKKRILSQIKILFV